MCRIYYWKEHQPYGRYFFRSRHIPCPNGNAFSPCSNPQHRYLQDTVAPQGGFPGPVVQNVEPAAPQPEPKLKKKAKNDDIRFEWDIHIPFTSREEDKKKAQPKKKDPPTPVSPLPPQPYHPFFDQRRVYTAQPTYVDGPPENYVHIAPSPVYVLPERTRPAYPIMPPRANQYPEGARVIQVEPSERSPRRRSSSTHRGRSPSPSPATRVHRRRPHSVDVHHSSRSRQRASSQYHRDRQEQEARNREINNINSRIRDLEEMIQRNQRRTELDNEINELRIELAALNARRAGRDEAAAGPAPRTPGQGGGQIFPRRRTVIVHQGERETTRVNQGRGGGRGGGGANRGHSRWDSGVGIDNPRRELDERGERVLANDAEDERRARLRGGWDSQPGVRGLLSSSSTPTAAAAPWHRRSNSERVVYEGEGRGGRSFFRGYGR